MALGKMGQARARTFPPAAQRIFLAQLAQTATRLHQLSGHAKDAVAALPRDIAGWRIASCVFVRSMVARNPASAWAASPAITGGLSRSGQWIIVFALAALDRFFPAFGKGLCRIKVLRPGRR
jgi:hypothetical protein